MITPAEVVEVETDEIGVELSTLEYDQDFTDLTTDEIEIETDEIHVELVPRGVVR